MKFAFENLDVYKRAVQLVQQVDQLTGQLKGQVSYSFIDQMTRAALSVPLNIAEGNGRWHKNDKKNFFWIARGSVFELVPLFELFYQKKLIDQKCYNRLAEDLEVLAKMLTALNKSVDLMRN